MNGQFLFSQYKNCRLCHRLCGVDRTIQTGFCGMPDRLYAARAALHGWEEPCISGTYGSGTVFFSGCSLRCAYCQNHSIALGHSGKELDTARLAEIFLELQEKKAANINLVTPTHYVPSILAALDRARAGGLYLPVVYNTGNYETLDTVKMLSGYVDVYLPDFKYWSRDLAARYSGAADYAEHAAENIAEMFRQVGAAKFFAKDAQIDSSFTAASCADGSKTGFPFSPSAQGFKNDGGMVGEFSAKTDGGTRAQTPANTARENCMDSPDDPGLTESETCLMARGVIVRHLMLPGALSDSKKIIRYLYETYGDSIYLSIMSQYTPIAKNLTAFPELNRKVTQAEYDKLTDFAIALGVENAFIQEGESAAESFIPEFRGEGIGKV